MCFAGVGARIKSNIIRIPNQIGKVIGSKNSKVINYGAVG
jgi:hypothetical protein